MISVRVALTAVLAAALAACASEGSLGQQDVPAPAESRLGPAATGSRPSPKHTVRERTATLETTNPDAPVATAVTAPKSNDGRRTAPLEVSLNRTCLDRGQELIVTATSEPFAGLGFAVGYSKPPKGSDKIVPDYAYFDHESNPTGTIVWSVVIRPTVPYGPGVVKVVANASSGGNFASLDIEISDAC